MTTLLVLFSYHHNNTEKVAKVFAKVLDAEIRTPWEIDAEEPQDYELVGFGSGIYDGNHHKALLDIVETIPQVVDREAFIFSTSFNTWDYRKSHSSLREKLESKGYVIVDEFNCAGWDTNSDYNSGIILAAVSYIVKLLGGLHKGRPNTKDLQKADEFAQNLKKNIQKVKLSASQKGG
jgi:flavodoxin